MSKKQHYSGIESLSPLLSSDPYCDYRFVILGDTTEGTLDCLFRLSFNSYSKLNVSCIATEVKVMIDREGFNNNSGKRHIKEKRYSFAGMQDYGG